MYFQKLLLAVASALYFTLSVSSTIIDPKGNITLVEGEPYFTFDYETPEPHEKNWIGLYEDAGVGLIINWAEKYSKNSAAWVYAPESKGRVKVPVGNLRPGRYTAFFHAKDGYDWLSWPFDVYFIEEPKTGLEFVVDEITLPPARGGDSYGANIGGLIRGGSKGVTFHQGTNLPGWLDITKEGGLGGRPGRRARDLTFTVYAKRGESMASLKVHLPVRGRTQVKVPELRIMSMNLWFGGTRFSEYHEKQLRFIIKSKADIIGIQEDHGGDRAKALAEALGWYYWASKESHSILSKFPIQITTGNINKSGGALIELDGEWQMVNFWVAHLNYTPYGPYNFCFDGMSADEVMQSEYDSGRPTEIEDTLSSMGRELENTDDVPVFLVGDFNAPSHLDWTDKHKHCGQGKFDWPTSKKPLEAGLIDSYRVAYPDPSADEGITYSSITPWNEDYGKAEPQERLDFIYHKGSMLEVVDSWVMMAGKPNHVLDEWTSDHAAVMTLYKFVYEMGELKRR
ncbi:endonuclease exonuclease phosphatase family [Fusarium albosuccineum]|uniref:Endonuclease exonuclease phosphatase family n=1 Tax=Fusarium albosuccineum TaxID=1237068 RepID=A0A8H4LDP6_9HYPO|nr:endonuclease exonuclease phosphatase family [Fusarium albosuccineum]